MYSGTRGFKQSHPSCYKRGISKLVYQLPNDLDLNQNVLYVYSRLSDNIFIVIFSPFFLEISNNCFENAVGISNPSVIPGNHLTASSQRGALYQPANGRLGSTSGDGWCAKEADRNDEWLQVDLGNTFEVCGVGSQGNREKDIDEWVTAFTISYSLYGSRWERYKDGNNEEFVSFNFIFLCKNM